jgi:hypothetical protein
MYTHTIQLFFISQKLNQIAAKVWQLFIKAYNAIILNEKLITGKNCR